MIVAFLVFVAFPAPIGFVRSLPDGAVYRFLYQFVAMDSLFNTLPSLHVGFASCIVLALWKPSSALLRALLSAWLGLLMTSTVLTHQHHIADVVSGFALAVVVHALFTIGGAGRTPPHRVR